jgi:hypothetical protein
MAVFIGLCLFDLPAWAHAARWQVQRTQVLERIVKSRQTNQSQTYSN